MSQQEWVAHQLKQGKRITPMDALEGCGCFRLGARIYELRQAGLKVRRQMVKRHSKRFAEYSL